MKTTRNITLALAVCAAVGASAAPADAAKKFKVDTAMFDVEVKGYQLSEWTHKHVSRGGCDVNIDGGGREVMRFRSKKTRLRGTWLHGTAPNFFNPGKNPLLGIPLRTRITRSGAVTTSGGKICSHGDGKGAVTPEPPDCGTKYSNALSATISYGFQGKRNKIVIDDEFGDDADPFNNCPAGPFMFPKVATRDGKGNQFGRVVPYKSLFRGARQHIIRIGTKFDNTTFEVPNTVEVGWEVKITRVVKKKRRK